MNTKTNSRSRSSRMFTSRITFIALAAFALLTLAAGSALMANSPGAIFTTESACDGTNINIFASKADVYLDGGPAHPGAAGLTDGGYCIQVTTPDGTVLGMSAPGAANVTNGEFDTCYQLTSILNTASSGFTVAGFDDTTNPGGEYKVWASPDCSFTNGTNKTDNFKVLSEECQGDDCNPVTNPTLQVNKYYDANANGINDDSQPIAGWKIHIEDSIDIIRFTPVLIIVAPDTYTVTEFPTIETNWQHTGCDVIDNITPANTGPCNPGPDTTSVTLGSGDNKTVEFGNLCTGAGGGLTLGFWSNKNGQATMNDGGSLCPELALLNGLNLRNATGANADFACNYTTFRTWLLNANAVNMAYMLSAQLAAMELNVESGSVNGNALIYAPGTTSANALGYATVNAIMAEADASLLANAYTPSGSSERAHQEALKNALDKANNNKNFVQGTPCAFSFAD